MALRPHTVGIVARGDAGRMDVEPADVSHYVESLDLQAVDAAVMWALDLRIHRDAPVDFIKHVFRVYVGSGFLDFAVAVPEWGSFGNTFSLRCYDALEYWRHLTPPELVEELKRVD